MGQQKKSQVSQPSQRRIPQRMCVICRQTQAKRALMRVVRIATADAANNADTASIQVDPSGKLSGRGAYLCHNPQCWQRAAQSELLAKALRTTLQPADRALLHQTGQQLASQAQPGPNS
jgi:uncharacterized protein